MPSPPTSPSAAPVHPGRRRRGHAAVCLFLAFLAAGVSLAQDKPAAPAPGQAKPAEAKQAPGGEKPRVPESVKPVPKAPATPPQAPATPPQAPATPPQVPATPPEAPATPPQAPATPPQAPATPPQVPATPPKSGTGPGTADAAVPGQPADSPVVVERNVYLPYEDLEAMFEKDGRGVFLPYREFLELWGRLQVQEQGQPEEEPPVEGVIRSARYVAEITGEDQAHAMVIKAEIEVESFREGWATVPLSRQVLSVGEAVTGEASLHLGEDGYEIILPHKGVYTLQLTLFAPVLRKDGEMVVNLVLPRSPVSRFEGVVPGVDWKFTLGDGLPHSAVPRGKNTELAFSFGQREEVEIRWRKTSEDNQMTPLLFADTEVVSHIIPGAVQTSVDLRYRVLRAGVDTFELSVPASHEVLSVEGKNLKEWRISGEGDVRRLAVKLHTAVRDAYDLRLVLEKSLVNLPAEVEIPAVVAANVARQSGKIDVTLASDQEMEVTRLEGLGQQAYSGSEESDLAGRFRFLETPYRLGLRIAKATPEIRGVSRTVAQVDAGQARLEADFDLTLSRAPLFETRLTIPAGYAGWEASGAGVESFSVKGGTMTVRFKEQQTEAAEFGVTATMMRKRADEPFPAPLFSIPGAKSHEGHLTLVVDSSLDTSTESMGGLRGANTVTSGVDGERTLAFSYRDGAKPGVIAFEEKTPQVTGFVQQLVQLRDDGVRYDWWIDYDILYAGIDQMVIRVPREIAPGLRLTGDAVKEIDRDFHPPGEEAAGKNDVLWAVRLPERKAGAYQLRLTYETPGGKAEEIRRIPVPLLQLEGVFRETGQVAVLSAANIEVGDVQAEGLEALDPRELAAPLRAKGVSAAFRYRTHPGSLGLAVSRNQLLDVPKALVTYADTHAVVSGDGAVTTEVIYWVRNRGQNTLQVRLPAGASMTSDVFVGDRAQQPMSTAEGNEILVQLPAASAAGADKDFPVRFVYELPSSQVGRSLPRRGDLTIPEPEVINTGVLQARLNLFLPPGFRYLNFGGPYELSGKARGWRDARGALDFLIPALGPQSLDGTAVPWQEPPVFSGDLYSGFNAPVIKEGQSFVLHRLGKPAPVVVAFLSEGLSTAVEAVLCLLILAIGLSMTRSTLETKFLFLIFAGLLPLALAGMVAPHLADVYRAIYLGSLAAAAAWILAGFWWLIRPRPEEAMAHAAGPILGRESHEFEEEEFEEGEEEMLESRDGSVEDETGEEEAEAGAADETGTESEDESDDESGSDDDDDDHDDDDDDESEEPDGKGAGSKHKKFTKSRRGKRNAASALSTGKGA